MTFSKIFFNFKNYLKNRKISNYFRTDYKKNVLISYIVYPLRFKKFGGHNNQLEIKVIAEVFRNLRYNVDVVFYKSNEKINYEKYDLIFGFGEPFGNSINTRKNVKRIFYATTSHPDFQNLQSKKRLREVLNKTGQNMYDSCRIIEESFEGQHEISDAIILLGNKHTRKTYGRHSDKIYPINTFFKPELSLLEKQHDVNNNNNYLFFTGNGAIHRGLDILLEFFSKHKQYNLYISSNFKDEKTFLNYYKDILSNDNINYLGPNNTLSKKFNNLINTCAFSILPSASEGQSTSITNLSVCGLIPIVTKECGFDLKDKQILINEITYSEIKKSIYLSQKLTFNEIKKRSKILKKHFLKNYNLEIFKNNLRKIVLLTTG